MKNLIFVHGFCSTSLKFRTLKAELASDFRMYEFNPRYRACSTVEIAEELYRFIQENHISDPSFVCHSFGGVIVRYLLAKYPIAVDRVVFLGVPHRGASILFAIRRWVPFVLRILGRPTSEIMDRPQDILMEIPKWPRILNIAGDRTWHPLCVESWTTPLIWDVRESDGKVRLSEAQYPWAEIKIVSCYHTFLPDDKVAMRIIKKFLSTEL